MKKFLSILSAFCILSLFIGNYTVKAAEISVPFKVSQGHAFPILITDTAPFDATVQWHDEKLVVRAQKSENKGAPWMAQILLAMPWDATGKHSLSVTTFDSKQDFQITALPVKWPESILTVEPKYVEPPDEVKKKISDDAFKLRKALSARTQRCWTLPLQRPTSGEITSPFGGRRVFNGKPRAPHKGTDLRCQQGSPIVAVADGIVVLAEHQYYGGNSILIDHGQGVFSLYCHLSSYDVAVGNGVRKGQLIAHSGSTGRVTGPHLHFGMFVQGKAVDGMKLMKFPPEIIGSASKIELSDSKAKSEAKSSSDKKKADKEKGKKASKSADAKAAKAAATTKNSKKASQSTKKDAKKDNSADKKAKKEKSSKKNSEKATSEKKKKNTSATSTASSKQKKSSGDTKKSNSSSEKKTNSNTDKSSQTSKNQNGASNSSSKQTSLNSSDSSHKEKTDSGKKSQNSSAESTKSSGKTTDTQTSTKEESK